MRAEHWMVLIAALAAGVVLDQIIKGEAAALGLTTLELALVASLVGSAGRHALRVARA